MCAVTIRRTATCSFRSYTSPRVTFVGATGYRLHTGIDDWYVDFAMNSGFIADSQVSITGYKTIAEHLNVKARPVQIIQSANAVTGKPRALLRYAVSSYFQPGVFR